MPLNLIPDRRGFLTDLRALRESALAAGLHDAAELLGLAYAAVFDGTEAEFVRALTWLAAGGPDADFRPDRLFPAKGTDGANERRLF